ncbi:MULTISPECIES: hypothetical protein [unclassified Halomonas]|uniref:hypothetical protein n=1 Tax=unclassified Halomonas TaxID=2609666 RepID=UPI002468EDF2|nr:MULTISPECIES: hypothetical protein [unclassified Halomonas]
MQNSQSKSSIALAVMMSGKLLAGVATAAMAVDNVSHSPVAEPGSAVTRNDMHELKLAISKADREASRAARVFETACAEIAQAGPDASAYHEPFAGIVHNLRECEQFIKDAIDEAGPTFVAELGLASLRRSLAKARSNAVLAQHLAWQTTAQPDTVEAESSGRALEALADHMSSELHRRIG